MSADNKLTEREKAIMNAAFMIGRVYANTGEKEGPGEIGRKLEAHCLCSVRICDSPEEPKAPLIQIRGEYYNGPPCPECGSDFPRRYWIGARHCVNPICKLHKDTIEIELKLKGRGEQLSGRTKAVLNTLASRGGRNYKEIERAYRRLKSFDCLAMCMDSACSLNRSLEDCVNDFEIRGAAPDEAIFVIRPRGPVGDWTVYKRVAPGEEKIMAGGDLAHCRQYVADRQPSQEAGTIRKELEAQLAEDEPVILKTMRKLMAKEEDLRKARALVGDRDVEIVLLNQLLDARERFVEKAITTIERWRGDVETAIAIGAGGDSAVCQAYDTVIDYLGKELEERRKG